MNKQTKKMCEYVSSDAYQDALQYSYDYYHEIDWFTVFKECCDWEGSAWFKLLLDYFDREWILDEFASGRQFTNLRSVAGHLDMIEKIFWRHLSGSEKYKYLAKHNNVKEYLKQVYLSEKYLKVDDFVVMAFNDNKKIIIEHLADKCVNI